MSVITARVQVNKVERELEIKGIIYELRTTKFSVTGTDNIGSPIWLGHGGTIDLAILDLCRNYQREKESGETG